jgi:uncharacterized glyoxalase superfamily protein PhnB
MREILTNKGRSLGMADSHVFTSTVIYRDPKAAMQWLQDAFGFEVNLLLTDDDGNIAHLEMAFHGAPVGVAGEWSGSVLGPARMKSPASVDGVGTQFLWIKLPEGLDAHHAHAKAAGARVTQPPEDQFYGARTYRVMDPEGHIWCFSQDVKVVSNAEMEAVSGLKASAGSHA